MSGFGDLVGLPMKDGNILWLEDDGFGGHNAVIVPENKMPQFTEVIFQRMLIKMQLEQVKEQTEREMGIRR